MDLLILSLYFDIELTGNNMKIMENTLEIVYLTTWGAFEMGDLKAI